MWQSAIVWAPPVDAENVLPRWDQTITSTHAVHHSASQQTPSEQGPQRDRPRWPSSHGNQRGLSHGPDSCRLCQSRRGGKSHQSSSFTHLLRWQPHSLGNPPTCPGARKDGDWPWETSAKADSEAVSSLWLLCSQSWLYLKITWWCFKYRCQTTAGHHQCWSPIHWDLLWQRGLQTCELPPWTSQTPRISLSYRQASSPNRECSDVTLPAGPPTHPAHVLIQKIEPWGHEGFPASAWGKFWRLSDSGTLPTHGGWTVKTRKTFVNNPKMRLQNFYITNYLSILMFMEIWVASSLELLKIFLYLYLVEQMSTLLLDMCLGMWLLDHRIICIY